MENIYFNLLNKPHDRCGFPTAVSFRRMRKMIMKKIWDVENAKLLIVKYQYFPTNGQKYFQCHLPDPQDGNISKSYPYF